MNKHVKEELEIRRIIAEIDERRSNDQLQQKKLNWFEFTLMLAVIAASVAITKLFL